MVWRLLWPNENYSTTHTGSTYEHAWWKKQFEAVQKVIDALPNSRDHTSEMQAGDKKSLTLSDNQSQDFEEVKHDVTPSDDQESMNMNDHSMIMDKEVGYANKDVPNKIPPKPEPKKT